jgi:osmoprotectant transport system substrate-binding protein
VLAAAVLPAALASCGLDDKQSTTQVEAGSIDASALEGVSVTVGSKDFDEQLIMGQMALLALNAAGAEVTDKTDIQGSTAARQALIDGDVDVMWEYTGTGWINYLKHDKPITDPQEQYEAVRDEDLQKTGLVWGEPAPMNNTYAMAVTDEFAEETGVQTLSDMADLAASDPDQASVCVESEFAARPDGYPGMVKLYDMDIPSSQVKKFGVGVVYTQLDQGSSCNFGEVFTTDGRIAALGLTVLEDDKGFFPLYNPSAVVREETDQENPEILEVLAPVVKSLTTEKMTELNAQVSNEGLKPEQVAEDYLREEGFIK